LTLDRIQAIGVRTAVVGEGKDSKSLRVTAVVAGLRLQRQRQRLIDRRELAVLGSLLREVPR